MRVFVTGATGFVGGHLLPRLIEAGWEVISVGLELEITNAAALDEAVQAAAPDVVVHLAALSSVADSLGDPASVYRTNYLGTLFLLRSVAVHAPSARVLIIGSGQQYGSAEPGRAPFREEDPIRPESPYAASKGSGDLLGAEFTRRGLHVVRVRAFNHTGPGQPSHMVVPNFARQLVEIERGQRDPVLQVGNLESVRDFLDVEDVIDAYLALIKPGVAPRAYNVCSGRGVSMGEILSGLTSICGVSPKIEVNPRFFRPADFSVGAPGRLRAETGWEPKVSFEGILERVLSYWRERLAEEARD